MMSPTQGEGDLPKGDVTPYAYLVKLVTRGRGQKSQKWVTSFMDGGPL